MKKIILPAAAAVITAALSLFTHSGVANAQELSDAILSLPASTIHAVNTEVSTGVNTGGNIGVSPEISSEISTVSPATPTVPVDSVLSFLSGSLMLAGRDILSLSQRSSDMNTRLVDSVIDPLDDDDSTVTLPDLLEQLKPLAAAPLAILVCAIPGSIFGAGAGALAGTILAAAAVAFAGVSSAALVESPFIIAGLGVSLLPSMVAGVASHFLRLLSSLTTAVMEVTWPFWFHGGLAMFLIGISGEALGVKTIKTGVGSPIFTAGVVMMVLGLLPGIAFTAVGAFFGLAHLLHLLSIVILCGVTAPLATLGIFPALTLGAFSAGKAAVLALPTGIVVGFAAGGVLGGITASVLVILTIAAIVIAKISRLEDDAAKSNDDYFMVPSSYALVA